MNSYKQVSTRLYGPSSFTIARLRCFISFIKDIIFTLIIGHWVLDLSSTVCSWINYMLH